MTGSQLKREVGAELEVEIIEATTLEFQIAVAPHPNTQVSERLSFMLDDKPMQPTEISSDHGNRIHKLAVPAGRNAHQRLPRRQQRAVNDPPLPTDVRLGHRVKIHGVQARRIHRDRPGGHLDRTK